MRQTSFILVAAFVFTLVVGSVAVYAYDSSRDDQIAEGVTVAGVDVGGLSSSDARGVVKREVASELERSIAVTHRRKRFRLSAKDAGLRADVGGMVDEALRKSRDGSILSRVARDITGGEEDAQVEPRLSYSRAAVTTLVRRVRRSLNQRARDAHLNFPSLTQVKEQTGIAVRTGLLRERVEGALTAPPHERTVEAPVKTVEPKVTRQQLAARYPRLIVVDRPAFRLRFYKNLKLVKTYTVAVGAVGFDTPAGLYHVQNKGVNVAWNVPNKPWAGSLAGRVSPGGSPENPLKARWMGIYDGAGIHGTDQTYSLGSAASHGCIRMAIPDVIELYDQVPVQTPVYIA